MLGRQLADKPHKATHILLVGSRTGEVTADKMLVALHSHGINVMSIF